MKHLLLAILFVLTAGAAQAAHFNSISAKEMRGSLDSLMILDIQVEKEYGRHHLPGAVPTYAYPAKSAADLARLDGVVALARSTDKPIAIVCPRGGGGAERTYDYLKEKGIDESRLFILEKGMAGWPYAELTVSGQ